MLFVSFLLQSVSLMALMVTMFFVERIQQLVGRPDGSNKLLAAIVLFIINALFLIGSNNGQYANSIGGQGVFITQFIATVFLLAATYELRNYVRIRALSRLNTQNPVPKPASVAPLPPAASEEAGEPQIVCNSDMEVVELNQGAARLLNRDMAEVAGKSITSLVKKEEMLLVPELFRQVKAGEAQGGEWSFRQPDETLVPVRISVRQHTGDQIRLVIHDLTAERNKAGQEPPAAAPTSTGNDQIITSLLDASADGYVAFDQDLKIVAWNTRMEKISGILREQCMNQHLLMHFPVPEELAEEDYFSYALEGDTNEVTNTPILNPNTNETHIVDHHFAPLLNPMNEIIGGMVIVRKPVAVSPASEPEADKTPPEQEPAPITFAMPGEVDTPTAEPIAEASPAAAETASASQLLEHTFAAAAHIVSVFDLQSEAEVYANRSLPQELGFSEAHIAELGDQPLHEIIHPEDQPNLPRTTAAWNDGSGISRRITEFRAIDPDRNWHWFQSADTVLEHDADGNVAKIVSIIQNITQDKEDERQLRLAEQKYRTFSEHCPTGIWHLTPGGKTRYANPAMCRILGIHSPDEMADRTYHDFITPDSQLNIATQAEPAPGETPTVEVDIQRPDGSLRKCLLHGQAELDEAGQIRNLMGSFVDVTDLAPTEPPAPEQPPADVVDAITHAALRSELEEALDKLKSAESARDEATATLQITNKDLEQVRASVETLQTDRDDALALAADSGQRLADLESQLESTRKELAEKDAVELNVKTAQDEAQRSLENARAALATAEAERDESKHLLAELNSELDETRQQFETSQTALAEAQNARDEDAKTLSETREELELTKSFLDAASNEQEQAKKSLEQTKSELENTRTRLSEAEKSRDEAQQSLNDLRAETESNQAAIKKALAESNTQLEETQTLLAEAEKERDQANQSLSDVRSELESANTKLSETESQLGEARAELENIKSSLSEAESARDEANQALEALRTETQSARNELEESRTLLTEAESERDQANGSLDDARAELETARTSLGEAEKSRDEANHYLGETRAELDRVKAALTEAERARDEAKQSLKDIRAEKDSAQSHLSTTEQSLNDAKTELEETRTLLTEAESERDRATQSLNDALAEVDQLKSEFADEKATREEADNALADAQAELKSVRSKLSKAETANEELSSELNDAKKALAESETVHLEVKTSQDETSAALAAAQTALADAEASRDKNAGELAQLKEELQRNAKALKEANSARAMAEKALQTTRRELEASLSETNKKLELANSELGETKAKADESLKALDSVHAAKKELDQQLTKLQAELDQSKSALADAEARAKESSQALESAEGSQKELQQELSNVQSELEQAKSANADLESGLAEANQEIERKKNELAAAEAKASEKTQQELADLRSALEQSNSDLAASHDELKRSRAELDVSLGQAKEECQQLQARLDEAITARKELEAKLTETTKSLEDAQGADEKLNQLREELESAKANLNTAEQARDEAKTEAESARSKLSNTEKSLAETESSLSENETALELAEAAIAELETKNQEMKEELLAANSSLHERQEAVAEAQRRFSNLQYNLTGIAYRQRNDDARSVEFISVGCAAFTGHAPEQFTAGNKSLAALVHPDDREQVAQAMAEAAAAGQGYQVDYRLMHEDGTERRVSDRGCGVFNAQKELLAFEGVITEVVERKSGGDLAETALHTLPAGIWITNAEGRTTYNNQTWTDVTGFESGNGLDWTEAVHGEDRARVIRAFKEAAARHAPCEEVFRVRQRDGQFCWMRLVANPRLDTRERFTGYLGTCFDITEEIHTAEELKAGQRQMEWAQTRAKLGSWEYHPATNVRRWSRQTSLIYNLRPDDELPASFEDYLQLVHEDDRAMIAATNDSVLKTGRPVGNLEFRTNPGKGPQRHLTATVYRVPEEDGSAYYLAGTVMDISDQKAAEDNVRRSEARYRKIIEVAEEGVWMMDAEGYTSFVNPRMMQMLGYRYREFIGRHFFEFLASESTKEAEEYMERRQQGISEQAEFTFLRKDGKQVTVLINSSSLKDADGDFIGILSLVSDITARKAANAEAEKQQRQIRTLLATAPDHLLSVDERKIVRFINRDYAGMKPDQIIGTPALNWVTPEHRERYDEALQAAFEKGEPQEFEMEGLGPDNSTATYHTRIRPVSENDKVTSLIVVSQDITGRAIAPAAKAPKPGKAESTDDRLRLFSRHVLKSRENELASLSSLLHDEYAQSLSATKLTLQSLAQAEENAKNKQRIEASLESVDKLLVRTRELSHNLRSPVLDDLGLFPALRGLVAARADSTGIAVEFRGEDLGRLDAEVENTAFRVTEEALDNLAKHAGAKTASVTMKQDGDRLLLNITDDGKGFDVKKASTGNTTGLMQMEERVRLAGGSIQIRSGKGKGASIELSLPLANPPAAKPAKKKTKPKTKAKRKAARKKSK